MTFTDEFQPWARDQRAADIESTTAILRSTPPATSFVASDYPESRLPSVHDWLVANGPVTMGFAGADTPTVVHADDVPQRGAPMASMSFTGRLTGTALCAVQQDEGLAYVRITLRYDDGHRVQLPLPVEPVAAARARYDSLELNKPHTVTVAVHPVPEFGHNDAGFAHLDPTDIDRGTVRVAESSAAAGPSMWLFYDGPCRVDPASHQAAWLPAERMRPHDDGQAGLHMTLEQAREVHAKLGAMIEHMAGQVAQPRPPAGPGFAG